VGYEVPWNGCEVDSRGNPMPLQPRHTTHDPKFRGIAQSEEQIQSVLDEMGVYKNRHLDDDERLMIRHLVCWSWASWDGTMRGVDAPPIQSVQVGDSNTDQMPTVSIVIGQDRLFKEANRDLGPRWHLTTCQLTLEFPHPLAREEGRYTRNS